MCDINAKSKCILIKNYVHLFLDVSVKVLPNFILLFDSRVINLQIPIQNILVSNTVLLTAVTCSEVTLC